MKRSERRMLDHMAWADDRVLEALGAAPDIPQARALLAHVITAERIWLTRLEGKSSVGIDVWPDLSLDACRRASLEVRKGYADWMERRSAEGALETSRVVYRNQSGREFTNAVADVLDHVFLHGAYHRGQIARAMREAGVPPVNTDFITFAREEEARQSGRPTG